MRHLELERDVQRQMAQKLLRRKAIAAVRLMSQRLLLRLS